MSDKTPLERDIETRELVRTPIIIKLLILILLSGLIAITFYTLFLKQELIRKDQEIIIMQEKFQNEKSMYIGKLKKLQDKVNLVEQNSNQNN